MKILTAFFLILIVWTSFFILNQICNKYIFRKDVKKFDLLISIIAIFSFSIIIYGLIITDHFIDNPNKNITGELEYIGTLGDLIGGLLNPVIAVPATLLTFLAFWVQYKANDEVRKQFNVQQFETELNLKISILRQEISEQNLPKLDNNYYTGREIMYQLDKELKLIYFIIKNSLSCNDKKLLLKVSYYIFFKGRLLFFKNINHLSEKYNLNRAELLYIELILSSLYEYFKYGVIDIENINSFEYEEEIENEQSQKEEERLNRISNLKRGLNENLKIHDILGEYESSIIYDLFKDTYSLSIKHLPFKGHETRLSLLFRQIFNIIKFVDLNTSLSYEEKRNYLRTVRSLLSNYDQSHIFYNWYSENAPKWEDSNNKYLTNLRMIHNIPPDNLIEDFILADIFSDRNFRYEKGRRDSDSLFENIEIYSTNPY